MSDTVGPMARTVTDAAIVLGAMTGVHPDDSATTASAGRSYSDYPGKALSTATW
jgi:amidase